MAVDGKDAVVERIVAYAGISQGGIVYSEEALKLLAQERFDMRYETGKLLERVPIDSIPVLKQEQNITIGFANQKPEPKKGRGAYRS